MLKKIILKIILIIFKIILLIGIIGLILAFAVLIGAIQSKLFVPQEYILWVTKYPANNIIYIFEFYLLFGCLYIFSRDLRRFIYSKIHFFKRYKKCIVIFSIVINIIFIYAIIFNVAVVMNNKIINYTFFSPRGKVYSYNDIEKIDTGVYGKRSYISKFKRPSFENSKGEFYYFIELKDGTKIDLAEIGSTKNDEDFRFVLERFDQELVNMYILKESSMENFEYCTKHLAKKYTDKIRSIILNKKQ